MSEPPDPASPLDGREPVTPGEPSGPDDQTVRRKQMMLIGAAALAAVIAIGALIWFLGDDGDDDVVTGDTTTTVVESTTTTEATTTTAPAETTTTTTPATSTTGPQEQVTPLDPDDAAFVMWPDPAGATRYDGPLAAARSFATELVGFTDPIVGEFRQGDARSGEVEVRAAEGGAVTTVLVRRYGTDDSWWVIAATTPDIEVDDPQPQAAIDDPLMVSGRARAFEGTVQVAVVADGDTDPIGAGVVTGRGDGVLGSFDDAIRWTNPGGGWGAVLFFTTSADDGRVWQVSATRVGFIGGD